jgi:hypothetical protein
MVVECGKQKRYSTVLFLSKNNKNVHFITILCCIKLDI